MIVHYWDQHLSLTVYTDERLQGTKSMCLQRTWIRLKNNTLTLLQLYINLDLAGIALVRIKFTEAVVTGTEPAILRGIPLRSRNESPRAGAAFIPIPYQTILTAVWQTVGTDVPPASTCNVT